MDKLWRELIKYFAASNLQIGKTGVWVITMIMSIMKRINSDDDDKIEKVDDNRNEYLLLKDDNLDAHHDDDLDEDDDDNVHLQPQEQPARRTKCGKGGSDHL